MNVSLCNLRPQFARPNLASAAVAGLLFLLSQQTKLFSILPLVTSERLVSLTPGEMTFVSKTFCRDFWGERIAFRAIIVAYITASVQKTIRVQLFYFQIQNTLLLSLMKKI